MERDFEIGTGVGLGIENVCHCNRQKTAILYGAIANLYISACRNQVRQKSATLRHLRNGLRKLVLGEQPWGGESH